MGQSHSRTPTLQHQMHTPGYYPVENPSLSPSFGSWFGVSQQGQDMQQGNGTQSIDTNPYDPYTHFS